MKKQVILLLLFCALSIVIHAQVRGRQTIETLLNIGYANSFISGDNTDTFKSRSGVQLGISQDLYANDRWSARYGVFYMGMGAKTPAQDIRLNYFNISVQANYHFGEERNWNINFGIAGGFLANGYNNDRFSELSHGFQLSALVGVGYKIELSSSIGIMIDAQSVIGLTNALDSDTMKWHNRGASINLGPVFVF